jgi:hypothetical protein
VSPVRGAWGISHNLSEVTLVTEELPGEDINDPPLPRIRTNYCRGLSVARQFGETGATAPVGLNVITPDASEQNARCPVVPTFCGVAVTT